MAKALIVSNDDVARNVYELAIKFQKIDVISVKTIEEAVRYMQKGLPDIVILDLETVDLENLVLLKKVEKKAKNLPVIILTEMKENEAHKRGCVVGACEVLKKEEDTLGRLIEKTREKVK